MARINDHLTYLDDHARLPFRRDCPLCQARLAGVLPSAPFVPPSVQAGILAGVLTVGAVLPSAQALASELPAKVDAPPQADPPAVLVPLPDESTDREMPEQRGKPRKDHPRPVEPPGRPREPAPVEPGAETLRPLPQPAPVREGTRRQGRERISSDTPRPAGGRDRTFPGGPVPRSAEAATRGAADAVSSLADPPHERRDTGGPDDEGRAEATGGPSSRGDAAGRRSVHLVQRGECLWAIAERQLGHAGIAAIAEEVERLWALNEASIGTGDPNLIYPGQRIHL